MAPPARIPPGLVRGPFTLAEAVEAGLTATALRGASWRRIARGLYVHASVPDDPFVVLPGVARLLPPDAVFSGRTASTLLQLEGRYSNPIDITVPRASCASRSRFLTISRADLDPSEIVDLSGLRITSTPRTLADRAAAVSRTEAVVLVDAAINRGLTRRDALEEYARTRAGHPGSERFRRAVSLSDGASESPMETRLRLRLVGAGLPKPELQVDICGGSGEFLGRVDLYYPQSRLCIEYDGGNHRDRMEDDARRQNRILAEGYQLLRFTAADFRGDPRLIVAQVRAALEVTRKRTRGLRRVY